MDWNKVDKWKDKERIEELRSLIADDENYWKKLTLIMSIDKMKNKSEFFDMITRHKREEQDFFEKEYKMSFKRVFSFEDIKLDAKERDYSQIMRKIIDDSENFDYNYAKASKQVLRIINYMEEDLYEKINHNFIKKLQENAKKVKEEDIKQVCDISELDLLEETKDILALIYNKYWNKK